MKKYKCAHCGKNTRVRRAHSYVSTHGMGNMWTAYPCRHLDKNEIGQPECRGAHLPAVEIIEAPADDAHGISGGEHDCVKQAIAQAIGLEDSE